MQKILTLLLPAALCGSFAAAQQFGCTTTTSSVTGAYGYVATEVALSGVTITPPGTNTQVYSDTPLGTLIEDINAGGQFWLAGVLYFDGAGHISIASPTSPGSQTPVGTYTVNSDCTITVTLSDVFNTTPTSTNNPKPTLGNTSLIGLVLGGGSEIDLTAPQSVTSTNDNTPLLAGQFASRLVIQLVRSLNYCSASSLTGSYGLIGTGFALLNTGTEQPATLFAAVSFDGNGNATAQTVSAASPLGSFQLTGTYTVNMDCSGSMTLNAVPASSTTTGTGTGTTTTPPPAIKVSFVLSPPAGAAALSGYSTRPAIEFTAWNGIETFFGLGTAQ